MVLPQGFKFFIVTPGRPATLQYTLISPGNALALPPQAGAIMLALLANYGRPVTQETMLATMYEGERPVNAVGIMRATLARLRDHLEEYGITFDLYRDSSPFPGQGPAISLMNLRQHSLDVPQDAAPPRSAPVRRGMVRPLNDDVPWMFPARVKNRTWRNAS